MIHSLTFNEIARIVSYTPHLNHLGIFHAVRHDSFNRMSLPIKLSKLTHLSIDGILMLFDQLKMFIKNIQCQLKSLRFVTRSDDLTYLHADQWQRFISQDLSQLEEFKFYYYEQPINPAKSSISFEGRNQFTSSFWITRKWFLSIQANREEIIYSIRPYKYTRKRRERESSPIK